MSIINQSFGFVLLDRKKPGWEVRVVGGLELPFILGVIHRSFPKININCSVKGVNLIFFYCIGFSIQNSTRLLVALFAGVVFGTRGLYLPTPATMIRLGLRPCFIRYLATAAER